MIVHILFSTLWLKKTLTNPDEYIRWVSKKTICTKSTTIFKGDNYRYGDYKNDIHRFPMMQHEPDITISIHIIHALWVCVSPMAVCAVALLKHCWRFCFMVGRCSDNGLGDGSLLQWGLYFIYLYMINLYPSALAPPHLSLSVSLSLSIYIYIWHIDYILSTKFVGRAIITVR